MSLTSHQGGLLPRDERGEYLLPDFPYALDALEPYISRETLRYHHDRHHAAYIKRLNALIRGTELVGRPLEEIITAAQGPLFNNAAQAWNHAFFWRCLSPELHGGPKPAGALASAIAQSFDSFEIFRQKFSQAAVSLFGSGWVWLVQQPDGSLSIEESTNADTPVRTGRQVLLACDVWEHAYYIDYRHDRARYIEAFWRVVNWEFAASRLQP